MEPVQYGSTDPHAALTLPTEPEVEEQEKNGGRKAAVIKMIGALVCILGAIAACEILCFIDRDTLPVHSNYCL